MKILFLTRRVWPQIGGVEKHIEEVRKSLVKKGHQVKIISEKDLRFPRVKFLGLIHIWFSLFEKRKLIKNSDVVHCHDVFIWYLPFRFLYPEKPVYTTFHGWEGIYPIPKKNIFLKKLASNLSTKTIAVGHYIEKYYGIHANKLIYGGTLIYRHMSSKVKNSMIFVGRLDKDTGVLEFIESIKNKKYKIDFIGDGPLRSECEKYGKLHGFTNPAPFYKKAQWCVPGGYLSYIEAKNYKCKIKVFPNNKLKKDYWKEIEKVKKFPTWDQVADEYLDLWKK